ncbi:MAG: peptidoglycan recognition family protein [Nanoarchaeota archaeon]
MKKHLFILMLMSCLTYFSKYSFNPKIEISHNINYGIPVINRKIERVIIHHTAANEKSVNEIRIGHKKRGFRDIAYHYVIFPNGKIETGRNLNQRDGGVFWNSERHDWIAIVLIGKLHLHKVLQKQYASATQLSAKWIINQNLDYSKVLGHKEATIKGRNTVCPGINMKIFRNQVQREIRKLKYEKNSNYSKIT